MRHRQPTSQPQKKTLKTQPLPHEGSIFLPFFFSSLYSQNQMLMSVRPEHLLKWKLCTHNWNTQKYGCFHNHLLESAQLRYHLQTWTVFSLFLWKIILSSYVGAFWCNVFFSGRVLWNAWGWWHPYTTELLCRVSGGMACRFGEPWMSRIIKYMLYLSGHACWISFLSTHY